MFELLLGLTALVLIAGMIVAYHRTADVLHSMLFLGPLFLFSTVVEPWLVSDALGEHFANIDALNPVLVFNFLGVTALVAGALFDSTRPSFHRSLQEGERSQLLRVGYTLALVGLAAYVLGIVNAGGFVEAFSRVKGGGSTGSGYFDEAANLGLVTALMVAVAQHRRGLTANTWTWVLLGVLPNLLQGTFGGRRGPLFLALGSSLLVWTMTRRRAPRLWIVAASLAAVVVSVVFIGSQRQHLYLGSPDPQIRWNDFLSALAHDDVQRGNNFVYGSAFILATQKADRFSWGRELAVNLLVRPVPNQIWPTKYADVGAEWVTSNHPGLGHLTADEWQAAVGWVPLQGSSAPCLSDLFGEFGWGAIAVMYFVGLGFAYLSRRRRTGEGYWQLLYLQALMLTIFLATQSFSAFYYRFVLLAAPTVVLWVLFVHNGRLSKRPSGTRSAAFAPERLPVMRRRNAPARLRRGVRLNSGPFVTA